MIVKRISTSAGQSKSILARNLVQYALGLNGLASDEKVSHTFSAGLFASTVDGQIAEMAALAMASQRCKTPLMHVVVSFAAGENPTVEQIEEAGAILLDEMGLQGHQMVGGYHRDTDNRHAHYIINRVHPVTERPVEINRGFDKVALARAAARVAGKQRWSQPEKSLFIADDQGRIVEEKSRWANRQKDEARVQIPERAAAAEVRTGEASVARSTQERLATIFTQAQSWPELHTALAGAGATFEKKGSGAVVSCAGVFVKASQISRSAALSKLEARLGSYVPGPRSDTSLAPLPEAAISHAERATHELARPVPNVVAASEGRDLSGWQTYVIARREAKAALAMALIQIRQARLALLADLKKARDRARAALKTEQWRGRDQERRAAHRAVTSDFNGAARNLGTVVRRMRVEARARFKMANFRDWLQAQPVLAPKQIAQPVTPAAPAPAPDHEPSAAEIARNLYAAPAPVRAREQPDRHAARMAELMLESAKIQQELIAAEAKKQITRTRVTPPGPPKSTELPFGHPLRPREQTPGPVVQASPGEVEKTPAISSTTANAPVPPRPAWADGMSTEQYEQMLAFAAKNQGRGR